MLCEEQAKDSAKKRNMELLTEHEAILSTNEKLWKRVNEIFGVKLEVAAKKKQQLEAEVHLTKQEFTELEENIRFKSSEVNFIGQQRAWRPLACCIVDKIVVYT